MRSSHACVDPLIRASSGLSDDLIRLYVGIEDPADLIEDLEQALLEAGAIVLSEDCHYVRTKLAALAMENVVPNTYLLNGEEEDKEWLVSAPGKVTLFGEHMAW